MSTLDYIGSILTAKGGKKGKRVEHLYEQFRTSSLADRTDSQVKWYRSTHHSYSHPYSRRRLRMAGAHSPRKTRKSRVCSRR